MCTLSWCSSLDSYTLFFNRDEQRSRKIATPPEIWEQNQVSVIYPTDTQANGTWITTNQFGYTLALLNLYKDTPTPRGSRGFQSRGLLVKKLSSLSSNQSILNILQDECEKYPTFTIFSISLQEGPIAWRWDGESLQAFNKTSDLFPLTSSSVQTKKVCTERIRKLQQLCTSPELASSDALEGFHFTKGKNHNYQTPCMSREDAHTVSISKIHVSKNQTSFQYFPKDGESTLFKKPVQVNMSLRNWSS